MARAKKTRKSGSIGTPKSTEQGNTKRPTSSSKSNPPKSKRRRGNAPGTRHNVEQTNKPAASNSGPVDKRIGSKKPIPLVVEPKQKSKPTKTLKFKTPAAELEALENDPRFNQLLDRLEDGDELSKEDQQWLDERLARYEILCDLLGIKVEEDAPQDDEVDPLSKLDAIQLDDFKD